MVKMLKSTGPEIDTNGKNGATDKCDKMENRQRVKL